MKDLKEIIEDDIEKAKERKDAHEQSGNLHAFNFERGIINALNSVLFDLKDRTIKN